jgi:hypothetical protein
VYELEQPGFFLGYQFLLDDNGSFQWTLLLTLLLGGRYFREYMPVEGTKFHSGGSQVGYPTALTLYLELDNYSQAGLLRTEATPAHYPAEAIPEFDETSPLTDVCFFISLV